MRASLNWDLRHCARRGHVTFRPSDAKLAARLTSDTAAGPTIRCLRCGAFVLGPANYSGEASTVPYIPRGAELRSLLIMRLLSADRGIKALFLISAGLGVLQFRTAQHGLAQTFDNILPVLQPVWAYFGQNLTHSAIVSQAEHLLAVSPGTLAFAVAGLFLYGAIQAAESVGLWLAKLWGEYLAVIASSVFLPFEIYEIIDKPTPVKVIVFVINVSAVIWLIASKKLFGAFGGQPARKKELESESILDSEIVAAAGG